MKSRAVQVALGWLVTWITRGLDKIQDFGESGEGGGSDRRERPSGTSLDQDHLQVRYYPHLFLDCNLNVDRLDDDSVVVWVDDNTRQEPIAGVSIWIERGTLRFSLDEPGDVTPHLRGA